MPSNAEEIESFDGEEQLSAAADVADARRSVSVPAKLAILEGESPDAASPTSPASDSPTSPDVHAAVLPQPLFLTVDQAVEKMGFGPFQILIAVLCFYCWICIGFSCSIGAILSPVLKCELELTDSKEALIATLFFTGSSIGGLALIAVGDRIGRRLLLILLFLNYLLFGAMIAISLLYGDSKSFVYGWVLVSRLGLGVSYNPTTLVTAVYLAELLPMKARGICIIVSQMFYAVGSMLSSFIIMAAIDDLGWQWIMALLYSSTGVLAFVFLLLAPESPRYYVMKGKYSKALKTLRNIARFNEMFKRNPLSQSSLACMALNDGVDKHNHKPDSAKKCAALKLLLAQLKELCKREYMRATLLLIILWCLGLVLYNASLLLPSTLLGNELICKHEYTAGNVTGNITGNSTGDAVQSYCYNITSSYYLEYAWTASAEIPGLVLAAVLMEVLGRKMNMALFSFAAMVAICLLSICVPELVTTLFIFLYRGLHIGSYMSLYVYSCEFYPTKVRGTVMGVFAVAIIAVNAIPPFIAQVLVYVNLYAAIGLLAGMSLVACVAALLLPVDTKGRPLKDQT